MTKYDGDIQNLTGKAVFAAGVVAEINSVHFMLQLSSLVTTKPTKTVRSVINAVYLVINPALVNPTSPLSAEPSADRHSYTASQHRAISRSPTPH